MGIGTYIDHGSIGQGAKSEIYTKIFNPLTFPAQINPHFLHLLPRFVSRYPEIIGMSQIAQSSLNLDFSLIVYLDSVSGPIICW